MKGLRNVVFLVFYIFVTSSFFDETGAAQAKNNGVYIVYMGAVDSAKGSLKNDPALILGSSLKRKGNVVVQRYKHGFSGFAVHLTAAEAKILSQKKDVVSVFPDPLYQLHTTRSWEFLKLQKDVLINSRPTFDESPSSSKSDSIIGILDTGIWPESKSFDETSMDSIPPRWKGTCMAGNDSSSFTCNKKLIGARFYSDDVDVPIAENGTPRDTNGHGTHVASTAAGRPVEGASYYGLANGTAIGGSINTRIAMYRVCGPIGCRGSSILAAFDDAIADGVDVLSLSLGSSGGGMEDLTTDPIAIGSFHAVEHGITVVCSAGNDGPSIGSVTNVAPWILTVAATTIDRNFESNVVLGGNKIITGAGINFADLKKTPEYPLIYGKSAKKKDAGDESARNCVPGSMDGALIKGKIVLCDNDDDMYTLIGKKEEVMTLGGVGLVGVDDQARAVAMKYGEFPLTAISSMDKDEILSYINSTSKPVATILPTVSVSDSKPAPVIAYFSSRGPSLLSRNIIKPDIAAPGVNILAAWPGNNTEETLKGKDPPRFNLLSGTSMSCPHVSGIAAAIKSKYPTWSPSAVKSAIMTTAIQKNNMGGSITTDSGSIATAYDFGAGEISTTATSVPGLIYETTILDYLNFLCYAGYNESKIKIIATSVPDNFTCPKDSSMDLVSNINYPSIAVSGFKGKDRKVVNRTLTNVADGEHTYTANVTAPKGLNVEVVPSKLQFTETGQKLNYQVTFSSTASSLKEDLFGTITWSEQKTHSSVKSPFVVSSQSSNGGSD